MTEDTLQQLAEKYGFVLIAVERAKNMAREAYLAGEKAGLEQAAKIADIRATKNHDFFMKFDSVNYTKLADKALHLSSECREIEVEIRKLIESEE